MSDHPGFDFWTTTDAAHPFPVSDIKLHWSDDDGASADAELTVPDAQPTAATVAERYAGIADSAQLWFAIECSTQPNGKVTCEGVLRGKHLHWFPDHGESAPGQVLEVRLSAAELKGHGRKEAFGVHGPHCDLLGLEWSANKNKVYCWLTVLHIRDTIDGFLEERRRRAREAELEPRGSTLIIPHFDPTPTPAPPPKPDPGPNPN